jgi:predicted Zn-dependent peptidase
VYVGIGARYEADAVAGISHFIEHLLFKGTDKRPTARDIAIAVEGVGGAFNAGTSHELTNYWVKVAAPHFDHALDVLTDMLRHSRLDPSEIEKERRVIIEEINETFDLPDELVFYYLDALMYPHHPLGRDVAGSAQSVGAITRAQMVDYRAAHYYPANMVVSVAGQIESGAVVDKIARAFENWDGGTRANYADFQNGQRAPRAKVFNKNTEQAHLAVSTWGLPREHPDQFTLRVLSTVLGEGMSSRLVEEIREQRALAYAVHSYTNALADCGTLGSYAAVEPKKAVATLEAMLGEWARLRDELVGEEELRKVKEFIKGGLLLGMEDTHSVAAWYGRQEALGIEMLTVDVVVARVEAVRAEDIQRVARDIFRTEALNLSVVGPFRRDGKFERALRV